MCSAKGPMQTNSNPHFNLLTTTTPAASCTVIVNGFPSEGAGPAAAAGLLLGRGGGGGEDEEDVGRASGMSGAVEAWRAKREDATVDWVRRRETGCGEAWASRRPEGVARRAVWRCALRFEARKLVRRLVRRRGGVGWLKDIFARSRLLS